MQHGVVEQQVLPDLKEEFVLGPVTKQIRSGERFI